MAPAARMAAVRPRRPKPSSEATPKWRRRASCAAGGFEAPGGPGGGVPGEAVGQGLPFGVEDLGGAQAGQLGAQQAQDVGAAAARWRQTRRW